MVAPSSFHLALLVRLVLTEEGLRRGWWWTLVTHLFIHKDTAQTPATVQNMYHLLYHVLTIYMYFLCVCTFAGIQMLAN